jgi:Holliday junction DNA helicase RuvB
MIRRRSFLAGAAAATAAMTLPFDPVTAVAAEALKRLDVDEFGLDDMDARILKTIIEMFEGGPVGVQTVAAAVGEDPGTLEEVYEPFLLQHGFIQRTPRGRVATPLAYRHFGYTPPSQSGQASLF